MGGAAKYAGLALLAAVAISACAATPPAPPDSVHQPEMASSAAMSNADILASLVTGAKNGDTCPELFAFIDQIEESSPLYGTAQDTLRSVGCYMRDSERTDQRSPGARAAAPGPWEGVSGGEEVTPSSKCLTAAKMAAEEPDEERAEPLIQSTLNECTSVNEWMSALEAYPGVMGLMPGSRPSGFELDSVCYAFKTSAVCLDAEQQGSLR